MGKEEIFSLLNAYFKDHRSEHGIVRIGVFGSYVKNQTRPDSDVDIVVELKKQDLLEMSAIKQDLEELFHATVDLVSYRTTMNPFLKHEIDREAEFVQD